MSEADHLQDILERNMSERPEMRPTSIEKENAIFRALIASSKDRAIQRQAIEEFAKAKQEEVRRLEAVEEKLEELRAGRVAQLEIKLEALLKEREAERNRAKGRMQVLAWLKDNAGWLWPLAVAAAGFIGWKSGAPARPEVP